MPQVKLRREFLTLWVESYTGDVGVGVKSSTLLETARAKTFDVHENGRWGTMGDLELGFCVDLGKSFVVCGVLYLY